MNTSEMIEIYEYIMATGCRCVAILCRRNLWLYLVWRWMLHKILSSYLKRYKADSRVGPLSFLGLPYKYATLTNQLKIQLFSNDLSIIVQANN